MFAKLNSYSWWLIGSWTSALGVLAVLGLAILLANVVDLFRTSDESIFVESSLWLAAATVTVASLFATTTKAEFIWSGALIGLAWLAQTIRHAWHATNTHRHHHYFPAN
jgi:hypothetical protein